MMVDLIISKELEELIDAEIEKDQIEISNL